MTRRALVSIHDLTPEHLPRALRILELLRDVGVPSATLLVVPGSGWTPETLEVLREVSRRGHPLAGHGWAHRCGPGRTLYHRLHGLLLSRDQAEHLSRPRGEIVELVVRCFRWFGKVGLPSPELYVPPAWAMGFLQRKDLKSLPFRRYEILRGMVDGETGRLRWLPLVGYEADTVFRRASLRVLNSLNVKLAERTGRPVRVAIHPHDLDYLMGNDLEALLREPWLFVGEEVGHLPC